MYIYVLQDHLNKFAGGSRKQSTSKSIRDQCFIASVLLRSLKFSDILFHLYNYLGAEHVSVALIAILRFFYGVNNRIKSKEVMDVFIETALVSKLF